ncbi:hypothetical protein MPER_12239 [Moniliophthora perniciosa FA553]|nr:hypothetical protein MPER_12239 [Moniliophthora perniciosa FA553]
MFSIDITASYLFISLFARRHPGGGYIRFPGPFWKNVKANIETISSQVDTLNNDIKGFSDSGGSLSEAQFILDSVQAIEPTIISTLEGITAKKPALESLVTNTNTFAGALMDATLTNYSGMAFDKAQPVYHDADA